MKITGPPILESLPLFDAASHPSHRTDRSAADLATAHSKGAGSVGVTGKNHGGYMICLVVWNMNVMTFHILGISSSQLTNSYFSEG